MSEKRGCNFDLYADKATVQDIVDCNDQTKQNEINKPLVFVKQEISYDRDAGAALEDLDLDKRKYTNIVAEKKVTEAKNEFSVSGVSTFVNQDNLCKQELENMQELNLRLDFLDTQFIVKEEKIDEIGTLQCGVSDESFAHKGIEYAEVQAGNPEIFASEHGETLPYVKEEPVCDSGVKIKAEGEGEQKKIRIKTVQELSDAYAMSIYGDSCPPFLSNMDGKRKRGRKKRQPEGDKKNIVGEGPEGKYKCQVCPKSFMFQCYLKSHEITHTKARPYDCEVCGKWFSHKSVITRHIERVHHMTPKPKVKVEKKFSCDLCGKIFLSRGYLNIHARTHTGERPFACEICEMRFTQKIAMQNHMRSMHVAEPQFKCKMCGKAFKMKYSLTLHEKLHTTLPLACEVCGKAFGHKYALKQHMAYMHEKPQDSAEQILKCQFCPKNFASKSGLVRHERIHTQQPSFMCEVCGMSFWSNYDLKMHKVDRHTEIQDYAESLLRCEVCLKGFSKKALLTRHQRMHTKENPFLCSVCGKGFRHKFSVKAHMNKFHSDV